MKPQQKAVELIDKFDKKALNSVYYTIDIWNTKKNIELNKTDKNESVLRGLEICDRTLIYWDKVKQIIKTKQDENN